MALPHRADARQNRAEAAAAKKLAQVVAYEANNTYLCMLNLCSKT
jgi:hypothetical protein